MQRWLIWTVGTALWVAGAGTTVLLMIATGATELRQTASSAWLLDPEQGTWSPTKNFKAHPAPTDPNGEMARNALRATAQGKWILVESDEERPQVWSPESGAWSSIDEKIPVVWQRADGGPIEAPAGITADRYLVVPLDHGAVAVPRDGHWSTPTPAFIFDGSWRPLGLAPEAFYPNTAAVRLRDGRVMVLGVGTGLEGATQRQQRRMTWIADPSQQSWKEAGDDPYLRGRPLHLLALRNGGALEDSEGVTFLWTPRSESWTNITPVPLSVSEPAVAELPDGHVLGVFYTDVPRADPRRLGRLGLLSIFGIGLAIAARRSLRGEAHLGGLVVGLALGVVATFLVAMTLMFSNRGGP